MEGHSEGFLPPGSCGLDLAQAACGQGPQLRGPVHGVGMVGDGEGRTKSWRGLEIPPHLMWRDYKWAGVCWPVREDNACYLQKSGGLAHIETSRVGRGCSHCYFGGDLGVQSIKDSCSGALAGIQVPKVVSNPCLEGGNTQATHVATQVVGTSGTLISCCSSSQIFCSV